MRVGFTGTRRVPPHRIQDIEDHVGNATFASDEFTTGACVGFDALAAHWLLDNMPDTTHRLVIPANLKQVDVDIVTRFREYDDERHIIEHMPEGSSYRDRNERILHYSDELVAVASFPELNGKSIRSGTWQTVRLARKLALPIHELVLWPGLEAS